MIRLTPYLERYCNPARFLQPTREFVETQKRFARASQLAYAVLLLRIIRNNTTPNRKYEMTGMLLSRKHYLLLPPQPLKLK